MLHRFESQGNVFSSYTKKSSPKHGNLRKFRPFVSHSKMR